MSDLLSHDMLYNSSVQDVLTCCICISTEHNTNEVAGAVAETLTVLHPVITRRVLQVCRATRERTATWSPCVR